MPPGVESPANTEAHTFGKKAETVIQLAQINLSALLEVNPKLVVRQLKKARSVHRSLQGADMVFITAGMGEDLIQVLHQSFQPVAAKAVCFDSSGCHCPF